MYAISSYRCNSPTNTHGQYRSQYTGPQLVRNVLMGYQAENTFEDIFSLFDAIRERDGPTENG